MHSDDALGGLRVLVTGATGFTGRELVRQLCGAGAQVRALARSTSDRAPLAGLPVAWIEGDVADPEAAARAVAGCSHVFHVAACYREAGLPDAVYRRVHVEGTQRIAEAAVAAGGVERFVHVSTVGVHGHIERPPADETAPFNPGDIYQRTKAEAELWLHAFARDRGLAYTVIRPAAIYGPGDRRLFKLFKMALWPVFPLLGRSRGLYHLIHVGDLCRALRLAAVHPAAAGEAFIVGDPAAVAIEWIGRTVASELGRPFRPLRLPAWPFFLAADLTEAVCKPLGVKPPIYRRRVAFYTKDRAFDTRKLQTRLGFSYEHETESGVRSLARWYREQGWM